MGKPFTDEAFARHEQLADRVVEHIGGGGDIAELITMVDSAEIPALLVHFVAALSYREGYLDAGGTPEDLT
jgi:hypothetical protein